MTETVHVRLNLSNSAENIPMVRQALAGFCEAIDLQAVQLNDLRTALTEACNNASIHAYGGGEGPIEVELHALGEAVGIVVRDHGRGLAPEQRELEPSAPSEEELPGIGLHAIEVLADRVRLSDTAGGGTEVAMSFDTPRIRLSPEDGSHDSPELMTLPHEWVATTVQLDMTPLHTARSVFPRVLRAMAARAYFTIDRLGDAQRVGGALLADRACISSPCIRAGICATGEGVDLAIGPVTAGRGTSLDHAVREVEPGIGGLADRHFLVGSEADSRLGLRMARLP